MTDTDNVIRAFSADHVVRLTDLSKSQLRYWDRTEFFAPHYASDDRGVPYGRIYSFKDLVGLRTLAVLRKEHKVPLQRLRRLAEKLTNYDQSLWSDLKIYVLGREPHIASVRADYAVNADGQTAPVILLIDIMNDMEEKAEEIRKRSPDQIGKVAKNRYVVRNSWAIAGTRIPTATIRRYIEGGFTVKQILHEYPTLTRADVENAWAHEEGLAHTA